MPDLKQMARLIFQNTLAGIDVSETMQRKLTLDGSRLWIGGRYAGMDSDTAAEFGLNYAVNLADYKRIRVIAIGKASAEMARGLACVLGPNFDLKGIIVAPHIVAPNESGSMQGNDVTSLADFEIIRAGHPAPDAGSFFAARAILDLLHRCDAGTLIFFLLSGGGSSLVEMPLDPAITLPEMQELHRALVSCGASINEINAIRKHLSAVKGGRLAAAAPAAMKLTLGMTDVPEGCESALGSGPTIPDPTTISDVHSVIKRYALLPKLPVAIRAKFDQPSQISETPKAGDPAFALSRFTLFLGRSDLFHHGHRAAEAQGCVTVCDNSTDDWPLARAADYLLGELLRLAAANPGRRVALIADGELSSPVVGDGIGGRNAAFVLECARRIAEITKPGTPLHFSGQNQTAVRNIAVLSAGTDGKDGSSPAAGAVADGETFERARAAGLHPAEFARRSDSYSFFHALEDTVVTGPTGNNLRDFRVLLAE